MVIKVNISEDSNGTYTKDAHSMYFLMIPTHSGEVPFIFGALILSTQVYQTSLVPRLLPMPKSGEEPGYEAIPNNVKVILYFLILMSPL